MHAARGPPYSSPTAPASPGERGESWSLDGVQQVVLQGKILPPGIQGRPTRIHVIPRRSLRKLMYVVIFPGGIDIVLLSHVPHCEASRPRGVWDGRHVVHRRLTRQT